MLESQLVAELDKALRRAQEATSPDQPVAGCPTAAEPAIPWPSRTGGRTCQRERLDRTWSSSPRPATTQAPGSSGRRRSTGRSASGRWTATAGSRTSPTGATPSTCSPWAATSSTPSRTGRYVCHESPDRGDVAGLRQLAGPVERYVVLRSAGDRPDRCRDERTAGATEDRADGPGRKCSNASAPPTPPNMWSLKARRYRIVARDFPTASAPEGRAPARSTAYAAARRRPVRRTAPARSARPPRRSRTSRPGLSACRRRRTRRTTSSTSASRTCPITRSPSTSTSSDSPSLSKPSVRTSSAPRTAASASWSESCVRASSSSSMVRHENAARAASRR